MGTTRWITTWMRASVIVLTTVGVLSPAAPALAVASPTVSAAKVYPVAPDLPGALGDIVITETAVGQLPMGDKITVQFADFAGVSTFHLSNVPVTGGSQGLSATTVVNSSSGSLQDRAVITVESQSSGSWPGVLTLTQLNADLDDLAANGLNQVRVWDTAGVIATAGSPITVSDANSIGTSPHSTFSAVTKPTLSAVGTGQETGALTITEPSKVFFHTGDVITVTIRDALGSADTIGLAGTPTVSGGGMLVGVTGLASESVQPNETGFKVNILEQDPPNGSSSTITISNIFLNTGQAPDGPVQIDAMVTTGSTTEHIFPGRVYAATVGGNTTTTSAGSPIVRKSQADQPAANLRITETPATLEVGSTFSVEIQEAGVTFSSAPLASVSGGDLQLASSTATMNGGMTTATWAVSIASSTTSTIVIGPITYDVDGTPLPGDPVNLLAAGSVGGGFTSQLVTNAIVKPVGITLFEPVSTPSDPDHAGNVTYTEAAGMQAPTGGSVLLISPYASATEAFRATYKAVPTANVTSGDLALGSGSVNLSPLSVQTPTGPIVFPPQTVAVFPVTSGSVTPSSVTFANIRYELGSLVPPGALVGAGVVDTGPNGSGTLVAGNDYANAVNPAGLGGGGGTPIYQPDAQIRYARSAVWTGNDLYNLDASGQVAATKVRRSKSVTFVLRFQNDGNNADDFFLQGEGSKPGLTVSYFNSPSGGTNITSSVVDGSYQTLAVAPTASTYIRIVVTAKKRAALGLRTWLVTATSLGDPLKQDAVKAQVKVVK
ncbi:MAG TPA: hypothetical protein VFT27_14310 [Actinomycetota bacterium]|nr:hypothetical protein [Actinomycetota bacterium]